MVRIIMLCGGALAFGVALIVFGIVFAVIMKKKHKN